MDPRQPIASRPFDGPADLAAMGAALSASWRVARPFVSSTVGDLEWWQVLAHPFDAWEERIRVWELGGEVVAYAWLSPPADLEWHQRRDLPPATRRRLVAEAIDWATTTAWAAADAGTTEATTLTAWALDADAELAGLLAGLGLRAAAVPEYTHWYRRLDRGPAVEPPRLPDGYRLRHVGMPEDLAARVEVHRSAFAPSRLTVDKYERLLAMPHYAPERDLVVEAPDGSVAAFTMAWWDPAARVGAFEPVGTHADHRRLGLARAVNLAGLALLRDLGAVDAVVLSAGSNPASEALYASAGFEAVTHHRAWTAPLRRRS